MQPATIFQLPEIRIKGLRRYQERGVNYFLSAKRAVGIMDCGTGKTPMSLAALDAKELFPTIVVCKASAKLQWAGEVMRWLPGRSVSILRGANPFAQPSSVKTFVQDIGLARIPVNDLTAQIVIVNYDIVWKWVERLSAHKAACLILDEIQACIYMETKQHKASRMIADSIKPVAGSRHIFGLTATPIVNTPADWIGILEVLGRFHEFGSSHKEFKDRYCGAITINVMTAKGRRWINKYDPSRISPASSAELKRKLKTSVMYRVTKEEAMPELPPAVRQIVSIELSNRDEYSRVRNDIIGYVRELAYKNKEYNQTLREKSLGGLISLARTAINLRFRFTSDAQFDSWLKCQFIGLDSDQAKAANLRSILLGIYADRVEMKTRRAKALVEIGHLREVSARGKIEGFKRWYKDLQADSPEKALIFVHRREVFDAVLPMLKNPAQIRGGQTEVSKEENRIRFQTNPTCRDILISIKAGEDSLNLSAGYHNVFLELPDTAKSYIQAEGRSFGRADNPHSVISHILIAPDTIDTPALNRIELKLKIASQITDDVVKESLMAKRVNEEILDLFMERVASKL